MDAARAVPAPARRHGGRGRGGRAGRAGCCFCTRLHPCHAQSVGLAPDAVPCPGPSHGRRFGRRGRRPTSKPRVGRASSRILGYRMARTIEACWQLKGCAGSRDPMVRMYLPIAVATCPSCSAGWRDTHAGAPATVHPLPPSHQHGHHTSQHGRFRHILSPIGRACPFGHSRKARASAAQGRSGTRSQGMPELEMVTSLCHARSAIASLCMPARRRGPPFIPARPHSRGRKVRGAAWHSPGRPPAATGPSRCACRARPLRGGALRRHQNPGGAAKCSADGPRAPPRSMQGTRIAGKSSRGKAAAAGARSPRCVEGKGSRTGPHAPQAERSPAQGGGGPLGDTPSRGIHSARPHEAARLRVSGRRRRTRSSTCRPCCRRPSA